MRRLTICSLAVLWLTAGILLPATAVERAPGEYADAVARGDWAWVGEQAEAWLERDSDSLVAAWLALAAADGQRQAERLWDLAAPLNKARSADPDGLEALVRWSRSLQRRIPTSWQARALVTRAHSWTGELEQAERVAQGLSQQDPTLSRALRARIALERGDQNGAVELLSGAIRKRDYARYYLERGMARLAQGRMEDAHEAAKDCITAVQYNRHYARAVGRPGRPEYAEAYGCLALARLALGKEQEALSAAGQAIRFNPRIPHAWFVRGRLRLAEGRADEALADLSNALERGDDSARVYRYRGDSQALLGRYEQALADYAEAERRHTGTYPGLLAGRGRVHFDLGRLDEALEDFSAALLYGREPGDSALDRLDGATIDRVDTLNYRAAAYGMSGRFTESVADLDRVIEQDPDNAAAHLGRGTAQRLLGRLDAALADHERAVVLSPDNALVYFNRAVTLEALGQPQRALADYTRGLELNPQLAKGWFNRAGIHVDQGRTAEAVADYDQAIALAPDDALSWRGRGEARLLAGEQAAATRDLEQAVTLDPTDAGTWYNLGLAREGDGQAAEAATAYRRFVELAREPDLEGFVAEARRKLEQLAAPAEPVAAPDPNAPPEGMVKGPWGDARVGAGRVYRRWKDVPDPVELVIEVPVITQERVIAVEGNTLTLKKTATWEELGSERKTSDLFEARRFGTPKQLEQQLARLGEVAGEEVLEVDGERIPCTFYEKLRTTHKTLPDGRRVPVSRTYRSHVSRRVPGWIVRVRWQSEYESNTEWELVGFRR